MTELIIITTLLFSTSSIFWIVSYARMIWDAEAVEVEEESK